MVHLFFDTIAGDLEVPPTTENTKETFNIPESEEVLTLLQWQNLSRG
jgi:hypothetical protein